MDQNKAKMDTMVSEKIKKYREQENNIDDLNLKEIAESLADESLKNFNLEQENSNNEVLQ